MSVVTDVVFITPKWRHTEERFQELFRSLYTRFKDPFIPEPSEDNGTKVSGTAVFHLGVNYADWELLEALRNEPWPEGSVLYISPEGGDREIKTW